MASAAIILIHLLAIVFLVNCDEYRELGTFTPLGKTYHVSTADTLSTRGELYQKCINKFGQHAWSLKIENAAEWNYLKTELAAQHPCQGCTRNFWTNTKYDTNPAAGRGTLIKVTGTTVYTVNAVNEQVYRYICQVTTTTTTTQAPITTTTTTEPPTDDNSNTQPEPENPTDVDECLNDNDIIVVLDSSGSIGSNNYKVEKVFAYDLARAFANGVNSRFGFTIFSSTVETVAPLTNTLSSSQLYSEILNADYLRQTTRTDSAILSAVNEYTASTSTVPKNLVVITDGLSDYPSLTNIAAQLAAGQGIRTFAVGVGGFDANELNAITGGRSDRVFTASTFDQLVDLVNPVANAICSNA